MRTRTRCGTLLVSVAVGLAASIAVLPRMAWAQTPYVPYHGKNQVRYDHFQWMIYETDRFTIYYYPAIEPHLERMAAYAESAYQHISSELRHDLAGKVSLILFQTSSEFQEQNVIPGAAQEGVGAFAEPLRKRIVMPMDAPPDLLYRLMVHELTHQFEFDMIPTGLIRDPMPLWINEGLSDHLTGYWAPLDLMMVRDAAVTDIVPRMSTLHNYGTFGNPRMIYNLGHAVFEFIETRWGKRGLQDYILALRKAAIGGGGDPFEEAFELSAEDFDQQFERYLEERFKAFRDKERATDYGRNLAPDPERGGNFSNALSVEPSPSGELLAIATGNGRDQEADIVLISARDGRVIQNMTRGFDQDLGFDFIVTPGGRWNTVPWISWQGDQLAYFVRNEKWRTLIVQDVLTRQIVRRINMRMVDDPESPDFSPDGRKVAFAGLQNGVGDIFVLDLDTGDVVNVTDDAFADSGPTWSPDGRSLIYLARISSFEKLFRVDLETGEKTQITFGTHDDAAAQFLDEDTLVFSSTAIDPSLPIAAEVARDGNAYNIWTLDLQDGALRQFTDTLGGNTGTVVLKDEAGSPRIAFISYYQTEWGLHILDRREPIATVASSDFGAPAAAIIDFQPPLSHTLVKENIREKGTFENMYVDGRPPVNLGVTSGGDFFGGSSLTISDVLGDQQFSFYAASVSRYRTMSLSYTNLSRRLNWALQGFSQTTFFYGQLDGILYDPRYAAVIDRDNAQATSTTRGGSIFGIWPLDRYRRLEFTGSVINFAQHFNDPFLQFEAERYQQEQFGRSLLQNGYYLPVGGSFVQETTIFREFGPLSGNTVRLGYEASPSVGDVLGRQTVDLDLRKYVRLGASGLLALRARGFHSWGDSPGFLYFGGNSEMRGYEYLEFLGSDVGFLNAELRFPLIEAMLTPIGVLGGIRGVMFANFGGGSFEGRTDDPSRPGARYQVLSTSADVYRPIIGYQQVLNPLTNRFEFQPVQGAPVVVDGFRLVDSRASYGFGLQTMALGFPVHFDWSWRTLFNKDWEDARFAVDGGSEAFRKAKFSLWIGYDF